MEIDIVVFFVVETLSRAGVDLFKAAFARRGAR